MATIELNFEMDSVERLTIEIEASEGENAKRIGEYLLGQFSHDEPLKQAYKDRKMTLSSVLKEIERCAEKKLNRINGFISDEEVYGWVLHFVQDGENKEIAKDVKIYKLNKLEEEEARKQAIAQFEQSEIKKLEIKKTQAEEKAKKAAEAAKEKADKAREESGQMSLFTL